MFKIMIDERIFWLKVFNKPDFLLSLELIVRQSTSLFFVFCFFYQVTDKGKKDFYLVTDNSVCSSTAYGSRVFVELPSSCLVSYSTRIVYTNRLVDPVVNI